MGRIRCGAILLDPTMNYMVLVQQKGGLWGLVKGGLEPGETYAQCVDREVLEEISVELSKHTKQRFGKGRIQKIVLSEQVPLIAEPRELLNARWFAVKDVLSWLKLFPQDFNSFTKKQKAKIQSLARY